MACTSQLRASPRCQYRPFGIVYLQDYVQVYLSHQTSPRPQHNQAHIQWCHLWDKNGALQCSDKRRFCLNTSDSCLHEQTRSWEWHASLKSHIMVWSTINYNSLAFVKWTLNITRFIQNIFYHFCNGKAMCLFSSIILP